MAFADRIVLALQARGFGYDCAVCAGADPEDRTPRIEVHVFGVPDDEQRAVNRAVLAVLFELEREGPAPDFFVFSHDPEESVALKTRIGRAAIAMYRAQVVRRI